MKLSAFAQLLTTQGGATNICMQKVPGRIGRTGIFHILPFFVLSECPSLDPVKLVVQSFIIAKKYMKAHGGIPSNDF